MPRAWVVQKMNVTISTLNFPSFARMFSTQQWLAICPVLSTTLWMASPRRSKALLSTGSQSSGEERRKWVYLQGLGQLAEMMKTSLNRFWVLSGGKKRGLQGGGSANCAEKNVCCPDHEVSGSAGQRLGRDWEAGQECLAREFGLHPLGNEETRRGFEQRWVTWSDLRFSKIIPVAQWKMQGNGKGQSSSRSTSPKQEFQQDWRKEEKEISGGLPHSILRGPHPR
jgi:hypothetical protein